MAHPAHTLNNLQRSRRKSCLKKWSDRLQHQPSLEEVRSHLLKHAHLSRTGLPICGFRSPDAIHLLAIVYAYREAPSWRYPVIGDSSSHTLIYSIKQLGSQGETSRLPELWQIFD
ncbi:pentatricopeptide repeat-containing protein [Dorcoceras hygrometricum]|uniref:Pentatricopeptide repeat-containing protein n=1 Tax=Dorcoceras hygrometricum TaxID=472368 RepID=A0A2Z7CLW6_9LAMI|nr:pentatricopeptide repeat-containing protein [Dorcoceras hygrometricum]